MTVLVRYLVPVLVEVNLESGRVARVQVDDEAVGDVDDLWVIDEPVLSPAERERAIAIATDEPWPAWDLGG